MNWFLDLNNNPEEAFTVNSCGINMDGSIIYALATSATHAMVVVVNSDGSATQAVYQSDTPTNAKGISIEVSPNNNKILYTGSVGTTHKWFVSMGQAEIGFMSVMD